VGFRYTFGLVLEEQLAFLLFLQDVDHAEHLFIFGQASRSKACACSLKGRAGGKGGRRGRHRGNDLFKRFGWQESLKAHFLCREEFLEFAVNEFDDWQRLLFL